MIIKMMLFKKYMNNTISISSPELSQVIIYDNRIVINDIDINIDVAISDIYINGVIDKLIISDCNNIINVYCGKVNKFECSKCNNLKKLYFKEIKVFNCNELSIEELIIDGGLIELVGVFPNLKTFTYCGGLKIVDCQFLNLVSLNLSHNNLTYLCIDAPELIEAKIINNPGLREAQIKCNKLKRLNLSHNNLYRICLYTNELEDLNLSYNDFTFFNKRLNKLKLLNLSNNKIDCFAGSYFNLELLDLSDNNMKIFKAKCNNIKYLYLDRILNYIPKVNNLYIRHRLII